VEDLPEAVRDYLRAFETGNVSTLPGAQAVIRSCNPGHS
jgi:hypothetical protein